MHRTVPEKARTARLQYSTDQSGYETALGANSTQAASQRTVRTCTGCALRPAGTEPETLRSSVLVPSGLIQKVPSCAQALMQPCPACRSVTVIAARAERGSAHGIAGGIFCIPAGRLTQPGLA